MQRGFRVLGGYMSPVHIGYGKAGLLPNESRLALCQQAVSTSDWIMVDAWETMQQGHSTTLPVLRSVRERVRHCMAPQQVRLGLKSSLSKTRGKRSCIEHCDQKCQLFSVTWREGVVAQVQIFSSCAVQKA